MIGLKSVINCIDNSGAMQVECIRVLKFKSSLGHGRIGDEIVAVVKRARPAPASTALSSAASAPKLKRGDVRHAIIVRTKYETKRADGSSIRWDDNACVMINNKKEMIGNRIYGPISREVRERGWGKVVALAPRVI
ncbi:mitochondrial 54S ribosomal protein YmL38/YmL34 [Atractiella rhizophila]|nr:mitochondrial 54S ribosomal protein YmL38/YmL34 [Atractiella rhizophila]